MNNKRKRTYDDAFADDDFIYGIISTGVDWVYLKLSNNNISMMAIAKAQHLDLVNSSIGSFELKE